MDRERKRKLRDRVLENMDLSRNLSDEDILSIIDGAILSESKRQYIDLKEKSALRWELFNSLRRLDILQELVDDEKITEIMINGAYDIFIEKGGRIYRYDKCFDSEDRLLDVVQQIVSRANRIVNESSPIVDVRLMDGSRVNVVLPPVALNGAVVTIRKFPEKPIDIETLISIGSITVEAANLLKELVQARYNIFISGGTGSGKTTFLNALSNFIPVDERIITIEDSAELQIRNIPNLVRLESKNANLEGKNRIQIRDLIKSALRMRPDRIIVGEVRDAAAIDVLTAMNTGHDGSLSTGHANSPGDMLSRLETMFLMGMELPLMAVRKQICSAVDILVHLGRLRDKTRRVLEIDEVVSMENGEIILHPLFVFKEEGEDEQGRVIGELKRTKYSIVHSEKLLRAGKKNILKMEVCFEKEAVLKKENVFENKKEAV